MPYEKAVVITVVLCIVVFGVLFAAFEVYAARDIKRQRDEWDAWFKANGMQPPKDKQP